MTHDVTPSDPTAPAADPQGHPAADRAADRGCPGIDRRTMLRGVAVTGALGASASLLSACGGGESGSAGGASGGGGSATGDAAASKSLGSTSQIPVGGGLVFKEQEIVVTQPSKGEFKAFSAICTHQGCPVGDVSGGTINCPCHGSKFNLDGTVANGPATAPLPSERISVQGSDITLG
jgi:nitrite reductase/ring-hydroxylating ferredoxin subunit